MDTVGGRADVTDPVLVVDDDPLVRSALTLMLGGEADARGGRRGAPTARPGLRAWPELRSDVVLMDIRMPVLNGLDATRALQARPDAAAGHRADDVRRRRARAAAHSLPVPTGSC